MPVFNKELAKEGDVETIIGPSVRVEGNFVGQGNVVVEGEVKGSIKTKQNLNVGEAAKIEANIWVNNALVAGEIRGNVKVREKLQLTNTAKIFGDVETKVLSVAEGAILNGKCIMSGVEEKAVPEKKTALAEENKITKSK